MLRRAVDVGLIERARRGVHVSKSGQFATAEIDSFELLFAIDPNAVVSFHSALEAHGIAHNVGDDACQFRSAAIKSAFAYSGISYAPFPPAKGIPTQSVRGEDWPTACSVSPPTCSTNSMRRRRAGPSSSTRIRPNHAAGRGDGGCAFPKKRGNQEIAVIDTKPQPSLKILYSFRTHEKAQITHLMFQQHRI